METLSLVVGMTQERVIGKNNDLPWPRIPEDMKHFRKITSGHAVIMGRKTWDSIPEKFKPLPKRENIVITRNKKLQLSGAEVCFSLQQAIQHAKDRNKQPFIIGGATIYAEALPLATDIYLTLIKNNYSGDTLFPEFDDSLFSTKILAETEKVTFFHYVRLAGYPEKQSLGS